MLTVITITTTLVIVGLADRYALAIESTITLSSRPVVLQNVDCGGTEGNISQCSHVVNSNRRCLEPGAGVICPKNDSCKFTLIT